MKAAAVVAAVALAGCAGDVDQPWFLDHDRIVAVRATPPHIASGEQAVIDGLVAARGEPAREAPPDAVTVLAPASLQGALAGGPSGWTVTAPDAAALDAARAELRLEAGAPVPLQLGVAYGGGDLVAMKTVWLGDRADNPAMTGLAIDGAPAPDAAVEVARGVDVPLAVAADADHMDVNWLTSCGTMHDFDLPAAYLVIEADDPDAGQLAVVLRDRTGGVTWRLWSLSAP